MTIDELKTKKSGLISETRSMLENVKSECRQMTDEEQMMFDNNLKEIEILKSQIEKLQDQLLEVALEKKETPDEKPEEVQEKPEETVEETQPAENEEVNKDEEEKTLEDETQDTDTEDVNENSEDVNEDPEETPVNEENTQDEDPDEDKNKRNLNHNIMSRKLLQQEIREAMENGSNKVNISMENRALNVTGQDNVHDSIIETQFSDVIEPFYANSIIEDLGMTTFQGLPLADIKVPIMGPSNCFWTNELGDAQETANTFDYVLLRPKRLSCVYPISKMFLNQDTLDVESKIKKDILNAVRSKLQQTMFSADAPTANKPGGLFYQVSATSCNDYKDLCELEAECDDSNTNGPKKYAMSNKAKAVVRSMIRGTNNTGMVYDHGEIDGTPVYCTSDIENKNFIYGDWSKVFVAQFGELELLLDPFTLAAQGQIRIVANFYVDFVFPGKFEDAKVLTFGTFDD